MAGVFIVNGVACVDELCQLDAPVNSVYVFCIDSIYASRSMYRRIQALRDAQGFLCPDLPRLGRVAALGVEFGRMEDLLDDLSDVIDERGNLLLLKNAALAIRILAKPVGLEARARTNRFSNRLLRRIRLVQCRRRVLSWFKDLLPVMRQELHDLGHGFQILFV